MVKLGGEKQASKQAKKERKKECEIEKGKRRHRCQGVGMGQAVLERDREWKILLSGQPRREVVQCCPYDCLSLFHF